MDTADTPGTPAPKLEWTTPKLEDLGGMSDVMNAAQPPNDGLVFPGLSPS